jgi:polysaccharide export outer membrane protein
MVTVAGDIVHPGRLPLPLNGIRILDAIALSGGTNAPSSDMLLRLTRRGVTRTSRLDEVVRYPAENIYLVGDDLVYLDKEPQSVVVLGATNNTAASANLHVLFNKTDLNLAEALGGGGGLTDIQADPYGVFVFRYEPVAIARALGVKRAAAGTPAAFVPVVYQVDMQRPEGFLMAQSFQMEDHDVVYVANSDVVQLGKMFKLFNAIASIPKDNSVVSQ